MHSGICSDWNDFKTKQNWEAYCRSREYYTHNIYVYIIFVKKEKIFQFG